MPAPRTNATASAFGSMWRALRHRNYRLFFGGQGISLIGTWMTRVATSWLVFTLSTPQEAAFMLGAVGFAGMIPTFFLSPFAGVFVDRWNRHRLLVVTQVLSLIQSVLLAVIAFRNEPGSSTLWQILSLSLFQGVINAFDMPARQSLLVEMIDTRSDLPNAIALNSSLVNGARLVGPAVAGWLILVVGAAWCFVVDAVSYVAVIAALLAMILPTRQRELHRSHVWAGLTEGFRYAFGFAPIRALLLLLGLVSFAGMPYTQLMPIFAKDVLHGGADAYGYLMAASGVGALLGALYLASRRTVLGLGRTVILATLTFGVGLIGFALSESLWLSLPMAALAGMGMMIEMAASNTILQTIVEENKRGRVMSLYTMSFMGMAPIGSLFAGTLASWIGAPYTVLVGGVVCLIGAGLFALNLPRLRSLVRPIYVGMGILPEVAAGVQSASEPAMTPPE